MHKMEKKNYIRRTVRRYLGRTCFRHFDTVCEKNEEVHCLVMNEWRTKNWTLYLEEEGNCWSGLSSFWFKYRVGCVRHWRKSSSKSWRPQSVVKLRSAQTVYTEVCDVCFTIFYDPDLVFAVINFVRYMLMGVVNHCGWKDNGGFKSEYFRVRVKSGTFVCGYFL